MNIGSQVLAMGVIFLASKIAISAADLHTKLQATLSYKTRYFDCQSLTLEFIDGSGQRILTEMGPTYLPCLYPNILKSNDARLEDMKTAFFSVVERCEIGACS